MEELEEVIYVIEHRALDLWVDEIGDQFDGNNLYLTCGHPIIDNTEIELFPE